jgi:hypothetical protein
LVLPHRQRADEVDEEVGGAAMARVLDLTDVLELSIDGFKEGTLPQRIAA